MRRATDGWSLKSAPSLPLTLLTVICFFLPTQLGRHFWPDWAYILGVRSDYLSPTVYLTDILILFLLLYLMIVAFLRRLTDGVWPRIYLTPAQKAYGLLTLGIVLIGLISSLEARVPEASWWDVGKILIWSSWGGVLGWHLTKPGPRKIILMGFLLGGLLQALVGLGQFAAGSSLGLWVLGERSFSSETPGIAQAVIDGKLILRSYSTLPHPNVLAFLMLVCSNLALFMALRQYQYPARLFFATLTILFSLALLTSLARLGIVLWLVSTAVIVALNLKNLHLSSRKGLKVGAVLGAILILTALTPPLYSLFSGLVDMDAPTVAKRIELARVAVSLWLENPVSGVGLGNFVVRLGEIPSPEWVRFLQPAHNTYLLVLAEVGIIGLAFWGTLAGLALVRTYQVRMWLPALILAEVLVAGIFDHYFWTLQQGGLLWWSIIGGLFSPMVGPEVIPARPPEPRS